MSTEHGQLNIFEVITLAADVTRRKHKDNPQSNEAFEKVKHTKEDTYKKIMDLLAGRGSFGATSKEIAAAFGVQLNCLSGRCSELLAMSWIRRNGEKRDGASVLVINQRGVDE